MTRLKAAIEGLSRFFGFYQWALVAFSCCLFLWLSQKIYFADSELFSLLITRSTETIDRGQAYKLLFSVFLRFISLFEFHEANSILFSRFIFGLVGVLNLILAASLYRMVFRRPRLEALTILFILGFSFYVERGFRVRADNLAATWHLLIIWYYFKYWLCRKEGKAPGSLQILGLVLLESLLLATTIKGTVIFVSLHVLYFVSIQGVHSQRRRELKAGILRKLRVELDLFLIGLILIQYFGFKTDFFEVFFGTIDYLSESIGHGAGMPEYFSPESFFHVRYFLQENVVWSLFVYLPIVFAVARMVRRILSGKNWADRISSYYLYCFFLICIFVIFPEKYPFLLVGLLPVLSLPGVRFVTYIFFKLTYLVKSWSPGFSKRYKYAEILVVGLCLLSIAWSVTRVFSRSGNWDQLQFIEDMTRYFNNQGRVRYYDVVGSLPDHEAVLAFVGPNQGSQNRDAFSQLIEASPSFIFYTKKMNFLEPQISGLLSRSYLPFGNGVYARGAKFKIDENRTLATDWMGKSYRKVSIADLDRVIRLIEAPSFAVPEYAEPRDLVPSIFGRSVYFYSIPNNGAFAPLDDVMVERSDGFVSAYDDSMSWGTVREKFQYFLISAEVPEIGISAFPPLDFTIRENLFFLFAYDKNF